MSTVAWRDKTIAADTRRLVDGHIIRHGTKLFHDGGWIMGAVGNSTDIAEFVGWFGQGRDQTKLPRLISHHDRDKPDFEAIVVGEDGVFLWSQYFVPLPITDPFWAIGSGSLAALGAMYMGADALAAVAVAAELDCYTGGPIDSLTFRPAPQPCEPS